MADACTRFINCGDPPLSFLQLLAACVVNTGDTFNRVNVEMNLFEQGEATPVLNCETAAVDPEAMLATTFIIDTAGNLAWAINIVFCDPGPE
jgi:hypothetical protein